MTHRSTVVFTTLLGLLWLVGASTVSPNRAGATELIGGDLNHDTFVDGADFTLLAECLSGSGVDHDGRTTCREADIDGDGDVDMVDFGAMQRCFSGPRVPGDPTCACARPQTDLTIWASPNPALSGQAAWVHVATSQEGISYQLRHDTDNSNVGEPVAGNGGTIDLPTDPLSATTTFNVLAINAAAGCSVQLDTTITVTVSGCVSRNRIGLLVATGLPDGYASFLQACAAAGKPVAVVACVDAFGPAWLARQYSPQTVTIGRISHTPNYDLQGLDEYVGQDPVQFAQDLFNNELHPRWDANPCIDVWEVCNEWDSQYAWQADFYIAMMDIAEAAGHRLALFSSAAGSPPESAWAEIARACGRANAHGNHILALHEYPLEPAVYPWEPYRPDPDVPYFRHRLLYDYLGTRDADCPLALTEVGLLNFTTAEQAVEAIGWYDTQVRQDCYMIGFAVGPLGGWGFDDLPDLLPRLEDYIIGH